MHLIAVAVASTRCATMAMRVRVCVNLVFLDFSADQLVDLLRRDLRHRLLSTLLSRRLSSKTLSFVPKHGSRLQVAESW